jgi:hypothetical protein
MARHPGAAPRERLIAFGVRSYALLSEIGRFISTKDHESGSWYNHPVYAVQQAYVGQLLVELLGADTRTEYLVDVLLGHCALATAIASVADAWR